MDQWELPLGWSWRKPAEGPTAFHTETLDTGTVFLHCADLADPLSPAEVLARARALGERVLLKGCSVEMVKAVRKAGGRHVVLGHAARIALDGYRPPHKVRNLARKGDKAVEVVERPVDAAADALAERFLLEVHPPGEPRLRLNYRTRLADAQRAFFALERAGGRPVGLVTLTRFGSGCWHVEQLARHPAAPPGTMESLCSAVIAALQASKARVLNLGEAPMYFPREGPRVVGWEHFGRRSRLVARGAPLLARLVRESYDVRGLYQFKNKFEPTWEVRALCAFPRVRNRDVLAMARACGMTGLVRGASAVS